MELLKNMKQLLENFADALRDRFNAIENRIFDLEEKSIEVKVKSPEKMNKRISDLFESVSSDFENVHNSFDKVESRLIDLEEKAKQKPLFNGLKKTIANNKSLQQEDIKRLSAKYFELMGMIVKGHVEHLNHKHPQYENETFVGADKGEPVMLKHANIKRDFPNAIMDLDDSDIVAAVTENDAKNTTEAYDSGFVHGMAQQKENFAKRVSDAISALPKGGNTNNLEEDVKGMRHE